MPTPSVFSMKLIVFLGAGISVPSGLPKVDQLTQMILRDPYHQDRDGNFISGRNPDSTPRQTYPPSSRGDSRAVPDRRACLRLLDSESALAAGPEVALRDINARHSGAVLPSFT